jgi:hypothetical protein
LDYRLMPLYLQRQLRVVVSAVQNMLNPIIDRGQTGIERVSDVTEYEEASGSRVLVPASSTDYQLAFPASIALARLVFIEVDLDATVKLGGTEADRAIAMKIPATGKMAVLYLDAEVDSIYITTGATATNVFYGVVGQ